MSDELEAIVDYIRFARERLNDILCRTLADLLAYSIPRADKFYQRQPSTRSETSTPSPSEHLRRLLAQRHRLIEPLR